MALVDYEFRCIENSEEYDNTVGMSSYPISSRTEKRVTFDDSVAWPNVLKQFVTFLSSVYGYEMMTDITVKGTDLDKYE